MSCSPNNPQILSLQAGWQGANWFDSNAPNASTSDWSMTKSCLPSLCGDIYRCAPICTCRNLVISKCGLPKRAGIAIVGAMSYAKKAPRLFPTNKSGCVCSHSAWMKANEALGCMGKSGVKTSTLSANASLSANAGTHCPEAKKPCKKIILFILNMRSCVER